LVPRSGQLSLAFGYKIYIMPAPLFRKNLLIGLVTLSAIMFLSSMYLFSIFHDGQFPSHPEPRSGYIYESNNHGSIVYITLKQNLAFFILWIGALLLFGLAYRLNEKWRIWVDPLEKLTPSQRYKILHGKKDR
jgi:hypothetical protein